MTKYLLAMCGIPGSGKTTLAKRLQEVLSEDSSVVLISTDKWRDKAYYANFTPEKENSVRAQGISKARTTLADGLSAIYDDTNYYASMRHELYILALENEFAFGIVYVSTPLEKSLEWNSERNCPLPEDVITRINERFDVPGSRYAWDKPIYSLNPARINIDKHIPKILKKMKKLKPLKSRKKAIPGYSEFYDTLTRQIVNKFLKDKKDMREQPEVSEVRKEVLKIAIASTMTSDEVRHLLIERLEGILHD